MTVEKGGGNLRGAGLDLVAGAVAGGVARTAVSPLDVIKIRFQVQVEPTYIRRLQQQGASVAVSKYTGILQAAKDIVREEGLVGLWRGNVPALLLVMPYTAIQFVVLEKTKTLAATYTSKGESRKLSGAAHFLSGSVAGAAATVGSYPFDLLRTILASQGEPKVYLTMRSAFVGIVQARGFSGLYAGLIPTLVEIIPYAGLQFGSYEVFKRQIRALNQTTGNPKSSLDEPLSDIENFFCGFGAGTVAKSCCHPLDVVKKRFQVEGLQRDQKYGARIEQKAYKSMADAVRRIVEREGWRGLYKGVVPSIVKAAPQSAITFAVYERLRSLGHTFFDTSASAPES